MDGIFELISIHGGHRNSSVPLTNNWDSQRIIIHNGVDLFHSNSIIFTAHYCVSHVNKQLSVIMECDGFSLLNHWTLSRTSEVVMTSSVSCILILSNQMLHFIFRKCWVPNLSSWMTWQVFVASLLSSGEMVGIVPQIRPWLLPHLLQFIIRQSYCHLMQYCLSYWPPP